MDSTNSTLPVSSKVPINRSSFAAKSQAAIRREKDAIAIFDEYRMDCSAHPNDAITDVVLLPPCLHLTVVCWKVFRKHVFSFPGWSTKRRAATPEEKKRSQSRSKFPVYFVMVSFNPDKAQEFYVKQTAKKTTLLSFAKQVTPVSNENQVALEDTVKEQKDNAILVGTGRITP